MSEENLQHLSLASQSESESDLPDSAAPHSASNRDLSKPSKASNIASDILLDIIEKAMYQPEDDEKFVFSAQYGPCTRALPPCYQADIYQYSAVNRWWRTVVRDIRPRDVYCWGSQSFRAALLDLEKSNIRSVRTLDWDRQGYIPRDEEIWLGPISDGDDDDESSPDARKMLFESFLRQVDEGIRDLILAGPRICPTFDVKVHSAWHKVRYFSYGFEKVPNCIPIITSILREIRNLESLELRFIKDECQPDKSYPNYPERPTYCLKSLIVFLVESAEFLAWAGGNSRRTLEELSWSPDGEMYVGLDDSRFQEDLSDVFPGDDLFPLCRLRTRGSYLRLLESCKPEALKRLSLDIDTSYEYSYSDRIGSSLAKCKNLEQMKVYDNDDTIGVVLAYLRAGSWPALVLLYVRYWYGELEQRTLEELDSLCEGREIQITVEEYDY